MQNCKHYGAATCLIDFTTSALIALWFACQEEEGKAGKVASMATDSIERFSTIRYEDLDKPIREFLDQGKLWKWEPSGLNNRIVAQQSVFVFGEGRIEKSHCKEIIIAADCKKDIIDTLENSFGIRGQKLFNDLAGFARQNAHDQPYDKFSAQDLFTLGVSFHQRGEYQEAMARYGRAIELNPQDAYAYNNRGVAKNALGDHQGAIADFDNAIERNSQFAHAYNNRGVAKSDSGDHQGAVADFDKAIELDPEYAEAYNNRGITKYHFGQCLEAIADYDNAIELNPQHAGAYYNRGNAKGESGDHLGAIADYDKAIDLNPQHPHAYNNRGNAKSASGDHQGAIADFDMAIELNPQDADVYNNRGAAKSKTGDHLGAISDFDMAIELSPQLRRGIQQSWGSKGRFRRPSGGHRRLRQSD